MLLHQIKAASAFILLEKLSVLGWRITVRTYRNLLYCGFLIFIFALFLSSSAVSRILERPLEAVAPKHQAFLAALFFLIPVSYLGGGMAARECLSSRRLAIIYSPQRRLFKAIDIPVTAVYAARCLPRIALLGFSYAALTTGFLHIWSDRLAHYPELLGTVVATPLLFLFLLTYVSSYNTTILPRRTPKNFWALLFLAILTGVSAYELTYWTHKILDDSISLEKIVTLELLFRTLPAVFALILLSLALLLFLTIRNLRRMPHVNFAERTLLMVEHRPLSSIRVRPWWLITAIRSALRCHPSFIRMTRFFTLTSLLAVTLTGMILGGLQTEIFKTTPIIDAFFLLTYITGLALQEQVVKIISTMTMLPRLRFRYENGFARKRFVAITLGTETAINSVMLLPYFYAAQLAFGGHTALLLLLIPISIVNASAIAAALIADARKQPDGTRSETMAIAIISTFLSIPTFTLLIITNNTFFHIIALLWTLLLLGGAFLCLCKRIHSIPCYS